jgi:magnesium transporter
MAFDRARGEITAPRTDELPELIGRQDVTLWIDLDRYGDAELTEVADLVGLHPLAVEECRTEHERPTFLNFDDQLFIEVAALEYWDAQRGVDISPIQVFILPRILVTVHEERRPGVDATWEWVLREPAALDEGPDVVLNRILKELVDRYFPLVDELELYLEELEDRIFEEEDTALELVAEVRKDIQELRQTSAAQRQVLRQLCGHPRGMLSDDALVYTREIYDDMARVEDAIISVREHSNALRELQMAVSSNRLGRKVQVLTLVATISVPLTLVAGIYGMNFEHIPLSDSPYGFPLTVGGMAVVGAVSWIIARWRLSL